MKKALKINKNLYTWFGLDSVPSCNEGINKAREHWGKDSYLATYRGNAYKLDESTYNRIENILSIQQRGIPTMTDEEKEATKRFTTENEKTMVLVLKRKEVDVLLDCLSYTYHEAKESNWNVSFVDKAEDLMYYVHDLRVIFFGEED